MHTKIEVSVCMLRTVGERMMCLADTMVSLDVTTIGTNVVVVVSLEESQNTFIPNGNMNLT